MNTYLIWDLYTSHLCLTSYKSYHSCWIICSSYPLRSPAVAQEGQPVVRSSASFYVHGNVQGKGGGACGVWEESVGRTGEQTGELYLPKMLGWSERRVVKKYINMMCRFYVDLCKKTNLVLGVQYELFCFVKIQKRKL